jgi:ATP-dependent Clp protease ATP-binding subunit ClpX
VNPLIKEDLKRILLEPKNSIIKQYKKLFELSGKQLIIKDDVYDYIVAKGFKTNSGARGLRNVVENILKQKMFDSPSEPDKEVLIDMDYVRKVESKNFIDPSKIVEIDKKRKITL